MGDTAIPGELVQLEPLVARVLAPNPSPFTFTGTHSHLIGTDHLAIIDPGPDDDAHLSALLAAIGERSLRAIVCTHTHRDHSPLARRLSEQTGAPVIGCAPLAFDGEGGEAFDAGYWPDMVLADGARVAGSNWTIEAVATPGHTSNHLSYALIETGALFSGDHVMGWSTSIVSPPDGDMGDYMASLDRLLTRADRVYYPAHGDPVADPHARVAELIAHRRAREAAIVAMLGEGVGEPRALVERIYAGTPPALFPAAERSVLAHLIDLDRRGLARGDGGTWRLA